MTSSDTQWHGHPARDAKSLSSHAGRPCRTPGFTLLELLMVLLILSIMTAMVVPSLAAFARGRASNNSVTQILALARFARTQAVSDGVSYRLQFDTVQRTFQLTMQQGGAYVAVPGDFGEQCTLPTGVSMDVNITPQPNVQLISPPDQTQAVAVAAPPVGQPIAQANSLVQNQHTTGQYVEFDPTGRTDPVYIQLTDSFGNHTNIGCASSTEQLHVLTAGEMQ